MASSLKLPLIFALLGGLGFTVNAAVILDVDQSVRSGTIGVTGEFVPDNGHAVAQTFTISTTGVLTELDVVLRTYSTDSGLYGGVTVAIQPVANGVPDSSVTLGSYLIAPATLAAIAGGWTWLYFPFNVEVQSGQALAFVVGTPAGGAQVSISSAVALEGADVYSGGTALWENDVITAWRPLYGTVREVDLTFRTYVNDGVNPPEPPAVVPEPSTYLAGALLLLPLGAGVVRTLRRRAVRR
jgi:hypothetical protein